MRRLGKMLFGAITVAVIGGTGLCANSSICRAAGENLTVGEVYNTALEASYGDTFRGVYENYLAGSPLEAEKADGVDTATGHLSALCKCSGIYFRYSIRYLKRNLLTVIIRQIFFSPYIHSVLIFHAPAALLLPTAEIQVPPKVMRVVLFLKGIYRTG